MNAPFTVDDLNALMTQMGVNARSAAAILRQATTEQKNAALAAASEAIEDAREKILDANKKDVDQAIANGLSSAMVDRLRLDNDRIDGIRQGIQDIIALPDPVGAVIKRTERPNGLVIERVRTPIGVIAVIYESRPNVTIDAGALCLKAGNAAILRGGSEALATSSALHACLAAGLIEAGLPEVAVQLVPTTDRAAVGEILAGLDGAIDVIVPRGGKSLVARVQTEARAPVLSHLDGICHIYVDKSAAPQKAVDITVNAKMRRTGICGAAETLLIDKAGVETHFKPVIQALIDAGCDVRGDDASRAVDPSLTAATDEDFYTEYLESIISVAIVDGVDGAAAHIAKYGSGHTEAIIAEDQSAAEAFIDGVDSAIIMHNASTQYADGGEFGLGAEIGIATGKLHARGPVGLEELTTYKNVVRGTGQTRP
ncbi:MAG: glutamate-5-semialdehyde dehydrogenase [Pseudomonadota bacterium]